MLYKYKGLSKSNFDHHLGIITNSEMFFCMGKLLNDPFEGQIIGDKAIQNIFQNAGICSFSRVNDNLLMWSHYGNAHNGICYGFDKKILIESIWDQIKNTGQNFYEYGDVLYTNSPPNVIGEKLADYEAKDIIFHKSLGWSYEQEYRIAVAAPGKVKFCPTALKKVFIGAHTPIWHHEYDPIWNGLASLKEDVIIGVYELNQASYGIKTKKAISPGALRKILDERKEKYHF